MPAVGNSPLHDLLEVVMLRDDRGLWRMKRAKPRNPFRTETEVLATLDEFSEAFASKTGERARDHGSVPSG
jgi:hypothetical protein